VPRKAIRLSPRQSGRRFRWTFEVSADVDANERARMKKTARKQQPPRSRRKQAAAPEPSTQPAVESAAVVVAPVAQSTPPWQPTRANMVTLAGVAVLVIATVAVPRQPKSSDLMRAAQPAEMQEGAAEATTHPAPTATAPARRESTDAARPVVKTRASTEAPKKPPVRNAASQTARLERPISPTAAATIENPVLAKESLTPPAPPTIAASSSGSVAEPGSNTTITGCLEMSTDGKEFRLAEAEGADAPKSRSWRTGFLKKRSAPVALIGAPDPLSLKQSVGKRVAATGLLTDRALQVRSVRVVGSSCN
jgi:hypothetical protein